jgi:hypothetical protein
MAVDLEKTYLFNFGLKPGLKSVSLTPDLKARVIHFLFFAWPWPEGQGNSFPLLCLALA